MREIMRLRIWFFVLLLCFTSVPAAANTPAETANYKAIDLAKAGKTNEAIAAFGQAIALDPNYAEPVYNRGKAYLTLGNYKAALSDLNQAATLTPNNADTYHQRGITKKKMGDTSGGIADYSKALRLDPTLYRVHLNRGLAYYQQSRDAEACADFKKAMSHGISQAKSAYQQAGCK
jgi:tetratricopeptide (TPR) repeat protein